MYILAALSCVLCAAAAAAAAAVVRRMVSNNNWEAICSVESIVDNNGSRKPKKWTDPPCVPIDGA
jgi:uncharacterized alpha-E superfamily protein